MEKWVISERQYAPLLDKGMAVLVALGVDLLGEPPADLHPVVWYGRLIRSMERVAPQGRGAQLLYGVTMLLCAAPFALFPTMLVQYLVGRIRLASQRRFFLHGAMLAACIEGCVLKPFFALRLLAHSGREVRLALAREQLGEARDALQALVSRDRSSLSAELVAAAAVESLAENLSDSVVAPLFYYLFLGLPGAAIYRLVNTFDSMIGYHGHYEYLGKAAARLDDVLNLLPSRITALCIIAFAPLFGGQSRRAWRVWRRDAARTASPNAGHPMAAMAGAMGIQLEKVGHYTLGDASRTITSQDIQQAEYMVWWIGCGTVLFTAFCKIRWSSVYANILKHA